jgi:hypothetical protein
MQYRDDICPSRRLTFPPPVQELPKVIRREQVDLRFGVIVGELRENPPVRVDGALSSVAFYAAPVEECVESASPSPRLNDSS